MQAEDYALTDAYLMGYKHSLKAVFDVDTGWFWKVLSECHEKLKTYPECGGRDGADALYDDIVESVNRELGQ